MRVAVVGAGVIGRLLSWRLARRGLGVTLYDRGELEGGEACSFAAAGMLSPLAEAIQGESDVYDFGHDAAERWEEVVRELPRPVRLRRLGCLAVARHGDTGEVEELSAKLLRRGHAQAAKMLDRAGIAALEPELAESCGSGVYLPGESQIDNIETLEALADGLAAARVEVRERVAVERVEPYRIVTRDGPTLFDAVADCRGLGARVEIGDLRGVRGEMIELHAPEVRIERPIRILHQRYPIYLVPRSGNRYLVGATCIESESDAAISVTSVLELLGAVYSLHPGFRYASVQRLISRCRPALSDNLPRIATRPGLVRINGLYRHGFLLAPVVTKLAADLMDPGTASPTHPLIRDEDDH